MERFSLFAVAAWFATWLVSCSSPEQVAPAESPEMPEVPVAYVTVLDRSEEVTEAAVRSVAALFGADDATRAGEREIGSVHTLRSQSGDALCYVVNYCGDRGFVVVSATKDYMPVLAFGDEGRFDVDDIDKTGVSVWLAEQQAAIEHAAELPDSVRLRCRAMWEAYNTTREPLFSEADTRSFDDVINLMSSSVSRWEAEGYTVYRLSTFKDTFEFQELPAEVQDKLLKLPYGYANPRYGGVYAASFVLKKNTGTYTLKGPYTTTLWHQGAGYNQCLPNSSAAVGCVPIAIGQIMKYYRYPSTYDWSAMPDSYATRTTAEFLKSVGIKVGIDYNSGDSGASIEMASAALKAYGYTNVSRCDHNENTTMAELNKGRLVYMRGLDASHNVGHAWVCDGYYHSQTSYQLQLMTLEDCPEGYEPKQFLNPYTHDEFVSYVPTRFHMNWGWGGKNNGYFVDDNLWVKLDNDNYNFAGKRRCIVNIYPVN